MIPKIEQNSWLYHLINIQCPQNVHITIDNDFVQKVNDILRDIWMNGIFNPDPEDYAIGNNDETILRLKLLQYILALT